MMASEYKKRGGDYNTDKSEKDESQKNLSKWGEEDWQTKEGSGNARQDDGSEKRYLPKKAWEEMTEDEKKETDEKKLEKSKEGKQHVENTDKAKRSRKQASEKDNKEKDEDKDADGEGDEGDGEEEYVDDNQAADEDGENGGDDDDDGGEDDKGSQNPQAGQKRTRSSQANGASKKQKDNSGKSQKKDMKEGKKNNGTVGSKHDSADEPAPRGSKDRLPKKGQEVQWKSLPGWVKGEVVEIATEEKKVEGKQVKASKEDPRIVLKSSSSGKIAVHKPDAVCFE